MRNLPDIQAVDRDKDPCPHSLTPLVADEHQIAALAYILWQGRGCPEGSPQEDWTRATQQLGQAVMNH
jgi:hypothetical protein